MIHWIWQHPDWPHFTWDSERIQPLISQTRLLQGKLLGMLHVFTEKTHEELRFKALTDEMVTTSAIEGTLIDRDNVRSSIHHRLGIGKVGFKGKPDRYIEGLLDVLLDATINHNAVLTLDRLYGWHAALFPTGYSGIHKIIVGQLRGVGDMNIVSGVGHKIKIHYLAPPSATLPHEMDQFLQWFNDRKGLDGLLRAAIAHLWFEKIHPFDDGNGRIGRAIIDMALAQDEKLSMRFYSLSSAIMEQRKGYYEVLDAVSIGGMDVSAWLEWFLRCLICALENTQKNITQALQTSRFWQQHANTDLNARQKKVLNALLERGKGGYIGGMTTRKYAAIAKVSRPTAYRELSDLVTKKCLMPTDQKGRSSAYDIVWPLQTPTNLT